MITPKDLPLLWAEGPHLDGCRGFEVIALITHDDVLMHPCVCRVIAIMTAFSNASRNVTYAAATDYERTWGDRHAPVCALCGRLPAWCDCGLGEGES